MVFYFGWRYLFQMPLIPMTLLWVASLFILPLDKKLDGGEATSRMKGFDYIGTAVFIVFAGAVLMAINRGNDLGWSSTPILTYTATAIATLPVLVVVENRAPNPILPFRLFREKIVLQCLLMQSCTWTAYMGNLVVLPVFLQLVRGWTTADAGLVIFCRPLAGLLVGATLSRLMARDAVPLQWVARESIRAVATNPSG